MVASVFRLDQPLLRQHPGGEGVRRPRQTGHAHRRTMDFMLSRHAWAKAGSAAAWAMYPGQQLRTGPSLPIVAGFSPLGGRFTASHGPGSSGCSLFFHLAMAGFYIDLLGNLIQGLISFFFFVESLLQEIGGFVFSQQIGISPHCAVASNLVVLYPLSSGNQSGVFYFSVDIIFFFKDLTALLYQTFHAFAFLRFGFLAHPFEDLFNPLSMLLGLVQMLLECVAQLV